MDAIEYLMQDHRKVEGIFQKMQQTNDAQSDGATQANNPQNQQLLAQLYQELSLHALAEENIFYPSMAPDTSMSGQLMDGFKEHAEMKALLGELAAIGNVQDGMSDKLSKLMKKVMHHVKDEEEKVFPEARRVMSQQQLQTMTQQLQQAKQMAMQGVQNSVPAQELGLTGKSTPTTNPQSFA